MIVMLRGLMDEGCQDRKSLRIGSLSVVSLVEGRRTGHPQSKTTYFPLLCSAILIVLV